MKLKIPKRHFNKAHWHVDTQTAHHLLRDFGKKELTKEFNLFRARYGVTDSGKKPVQVDTVRRYANGGVGYENGPPHLYTLFIDMLYNVTTKKVYQR